MPAKTFNRSTVLALGVLMALGLMRPALAQDDFVSLQWLGSLIGQAAPTLDEDGWLKDSLPSKDYFVRQVVLLDVFDYTHARWTFTLPYLKEWHRRYKDAGLRVVGLHMAQYTESAVTENIKQGIDVQQLSWPVWSDRLGKIKAQWNLTHLPRQILIDNTGQVVFEHQGEGDYQEIEAHIVDALEKLNPEFRPGKPTPYLLERDQPGQILWSVTPELYLGHGQGPLGNLRSLIKDQINRCEYNPVHVSPGHFYLSGPWRSETECLVSAGPRYYPEDHLLLVCQAADVYAVIRSSGRDPVKVYVFLDDKALESSAAGEQVEFDRERQSYVMAKQLRLVHVLKADPQSAHRLKFNPAGTGATFYGFYFRSQLRSGKG